MNGNATKFALLPFDVALVSETSTTHAMQRGLSSSYAKQGLQVLWGRPVPAQRTCLNGSESVRGSAMGVCMLSRNTVSARPCRSPLVEHWDATCRILVTFLHLPMMMVRVIIIYGVPSSVPNAAQKNATLWSFLLEVTAESDVPTLIGGDMNLRPQTLDLWSDFQALGFCEVFEQYHIRNQVDLPPTCAGATRNDTLMYSRHFAMHFHDAKVHSEGLFPTHDPLVVTFNLATYSHKYQVLKMPCALNDDVLKSELFKHNQHLLLDDAALHPRGCNQQVQKCDIHRNTTKIFANIATVFEDAYDKTVADFNKVLSADHAVPARRSKQERRLHPRKPMPVRQKNASARARVGDYEPPFETYHIRELQLVKQVRRVQALLRRLKKVDHQPPAEHVNRQNVREWLAILTNRSFKPSFECWCLRKKLVNIWYHDVPPADWLEELYKMMRAVADDMVRRTHEARKKHFVYRLNVDLLHFGGSIACAAIKERKNPMPAAFEIEHTHVATLIRTQGKSAPKARKAWSAINLAVVGTPKHFAVTRIERVLGVTLHFARMTQHGCQGTRLQEGLARLDRLSKLQIPMEQAARLIQSTVWPMALFGSEVVYIGKSHFTKLRSHAAAILTKKTAATSNFLALSMLTRRVTDPFVFAVTRALCLWRRLFAMTKEHRQLFVTTLSLASTNPCSAFGPAATLKCYLQIVGWTVCDDGRIHDHLNRYFFLDEVTPAFAINSFRDAWDRHVTSTVTERRGFDNWPEVDTTLTMRVPLPDDSRQRAVLCKLRTLGTLYSTQQKHWDGHEEWITGKCPLCDADDTREHFPFRCPAISDLRAEYSRTLEQITMQYPHCCFLPVIYKHPKQSILNHLHSKREMPAPFRMCDFPFPNGCKPVFFTDGSAAFPGLGGQLAAWAIVLDLNTTDAQRKQTIQNMSDYSVTPPTFHPVQISLVAGTQTINRAELQCILQIVLSTDGAVIYSDSEWALNNFERVKADPDPDRYWQCEHSDILLQLCCLAEVKDLGNYEIRKIKSHQDVSSLEDPMDIYNAMGNRFVDELARNATKREASPLHAICWDVSEWYTVQISLLKAVQPFLACAEILRLDGLQKQTPNPDFAVKESFTIEHAILWQPTDLQPQIEFEPPSKLLAAFQPSPGALLQLIQWCGTLQWPTSDDVSGGISWFELTVNFLMITQCAIPVATQRKVQHPVFRDPVLHADAVLFNKTVWDCVRFVESGLHFIQRFTGVSLVPMAQQCRKWFLSAYGYQKRITGLVVRPILPLQLEHIALLKSVITSEELKIPDVSGFQCWFPRRILEEDKLTHRQRYLNHRSLSNYVRRHGVL
eukprot:Skav217961  [mRNA]  locus=scaffold3450:87992:93123:- [translate_table: standard]